MKTKAYTRKEIESWVNLDDYIRSDLAKKCSTNVPVVFVAAQGYANAAYPWITGYECLYLGDVAGAPGHGVFANNAGLVKWGYHTDSFYIPPGVLEKIEEFTGFKYVKMKFVSDEDAENI